MSVGFIKIHRALFDNWVADEPEALAVWVRILSEANFKDKKKKFNGSLVMVRRGQLIFGLNAFAERSGVSVMKLRRIISDLESDGMINRQKTNRYSLLTVVAYDSYQGLTSQEQANNKPLTDKQHADNTQLTTPKECKNEKNEKNEIDMPEKPTASPIPYQQIVDLYHKCCPQLSTIQKLSPARKSRIKTFWNNEGKHKDLDFIERYFNYVATSDFLNGNVTDNNRSKPWKADIEWLFNLNNFTKVIEGQYHGDT